MTAPRSGVYYGVSIDWEHDSLAAYARRLGHDPAIAVTFAGFPMTRRDRINVSAAVDQATGVHSALLLTLEPHQGLAAVTKAAATTLARQLKGYNQRGVAVIVRFAHEMNGSWYPWGQQPKAYVAAFRRVAVAVHHGAPGSLMMWAPSYGGGYPFTGGAYEAAPGSADALALDTDHDGTLDATDDSYAPYWPGDRYVDWVGMSLYHWGTAYPWGENEVPQAGKFADELLGRFQGPGADERVVPNFYATYGTGHHKPVAISETAALYNPTGGGAGALAVKSGWWQQVFARNLQRQLPRLKLIDWFEWDKYESEVGGPVDWTVTRSRAIRRAFRHALPSWLRYGARRC